MKSKLRIMGTFLSVAVLSVGLMAQPTSASRYDSQIQQKVTSRLQDKKEFQNINSSVEDGIVTLTGTVDVYQKKLDAAKKARKVQSVQGVRNLIEVAGPSVPDQQLRDKLANKLFYDRVGYYDNAFNYYTLSVKDGVVTVGGETCNDVGRDTALSIIQNMPGVKDVVSEIKLAPTSIFDDGIRVRAARAIYRDPVLSKYAVDPARPIRIIVNNGNVSLYGVVDSPMDKQIAGMRVNSVFGAFSVQNNLMVEGGSNPGM
jgi:hyperosmotically inducible periplasmic protein